MKTKDKILLEALKQFNQKGTSEVSIRSIAVVLGISAGNLAYHFKNTETIIYQLYLNLVEELNQQILELQQEEHAGNLKKVIDQAYLTYRIMYRYRFLLIDFVHICRRISKIRLHFQELIDMRKLQFRLGIEDMIQKGIMKEEWEEGLYDKYIQQIIILSNSWIPDAVIHFDGESDQVIKHYADIFINSLVPFLTVKGLKIYREYLAATYHPLSD